MCLVIDMRCGLSSINTVNVQCLHFLAHYTSPSTCARSLTVTILLFDSKVYYGIQEQQASLLF